MGCIGFSIAHYLDFVIKNLVDRENLSRYNGRKGVKTMIVVTKDKAEKFNPKKAEKPKKETSKKQ